MREVVILTEAGKGVGLGHLTRCLALCQGFSATGCAVRLIVNGDRSAAPLLSGVRHAWADWRRPGVLRQYLRGVDIAVVDSYLARLQTYRMVSEIVPVPAYFDDDKRLKYPRGVIINGNANASGLRYPGAGRTAHLLGLQYALLRREFARVPAPRPRREVRSVLITVGGQDNHGIVPGLLSKLEERLPHLSKRVVIGRSFQNTQAIARAAGNETSLARFPKAADMKRLMQGSDVAICAGGQTLNELARMGVPALVIVTAENQRAAALTWQRLGAARCCGDWATEDLAGRAVRALERLIRDRAGRERMSRLGRRHIDGRGAERIATQLLTIRERQGKERRVHETR